MIYSRIDSRSQIIYYSTGGDIDSLYNVSRLNTINKNNFKLNHMNSVDLTYLNHIKYKNHLSEKNRNKTWWVGSVYSEIYNFPSPTYIKKTKQKDIKENNTSKPDSFFQLLGGKHREWKLEIADISKKYLKDQIQSVGEVMGELKYALKNINRTDFPIFLDPKTASFIDVGIHAKIRQWLADSTIEKNLRYCRYMEKHKQPIDFRKLTPEMFIKHMDYRIEYENASPHALAHEKKAIIMFLRAFGQYSDEWKMLCKTPPVVINEDNIEIPFPNEVNQLYKAKYSNDRYENVLLQSIVFIGFNFGMRPPSEIVNLNVDDVKINNDGTGYIKITEKKKRNKPRIIIPFNKSALSSNVFKTPGNYIKNWRWKKENDKSGDALFLQTNGRRITEKYIRSHIVPVAKSIVGNYFHLYTMRHTFATYLYEYTKDLKFTSKMLGHSKITNTNKYVHIAKTMKMQLGNRNLFNNALRLQKNVRGKHYYKHRRILDCWLKIKQSNKFSPVE